VQLLVGVVISGGIWSFDPSKLPGCTVADLKKLLPLALCNAGAHSASVFALAAGGVAFGQIVKAAEPVFAAGITTVFYSAKISKAKWICLVPIIGGIAFSMLTLDRKTWQPIIDSNFFSLGGLIGALIANAFAAFKGAEQGKLKHDEGLKARMGGEANQYAVVNILSFLVSVPLMLIYPAINGADPIANVKAFTTYTINNQSVFLYVTLSGAVFYFYNYVSFQCLHYLTPSENSVANTAKRAIIIFGDAAWYNKIITLEQYIGSSVCIVGVCLYGMIDDVMKKMKDSAEKKNN